MTSLIRIIKEVVEDYSRHVSGSRVREYQAEDALSKNILKQELCSTNSGRIVFFALPAVIISVVFAIITIANMSKGDLKQSVLCLSGLLVIIFGCGCLSVLVYREYIRKKNDVKKLQRLIPVFWIVFSLGLLLTTVADFSIGVFAGRYYLFLVVMTVVPLFDLKRSALVIAPYLIMTLIFGIIFGADFITLFLAVVFSLAYLVISSLVYSSHCCLVISGRQLNTANERCRQMDGKDSLTGLLNKKGLTGRLMEIIDRGADKNIAAVFFGIDNFREYNRRHNDTEGDRCLYNICNCVRITAKSKTDIVSRYGGDEFVLILQNTNEYDLIYFAEQLRRSVERMALPFDKEGGIVTVSVGVSAIVEGDFNDYSGLLRDAEESLSLAKSGGKNCVGYMGNVFKAKSD